MMFETHLLLGLLDLVGHLDDEVGDSVLGQRLPRLDVVHLRLHQVHVFHVGVRIENSRDNLREIVTKKWMKA